MTWRIVGRLTHLTAADQRRLWRLLIIGCAALFLAAWGALSVLTHMEEKAYARAGRTYLEVAPLAAEVMDLRDRRGQLDNFAPMAAAQQVARTENIGDDRLRISLEQSPEGGQRVRLQASDLTLRELVQLLRDLRLVAGLRTDAADVSPSPDNPKRAVVDLLLQR